MGEVIVHALNDVSLELNANEITAVLGPSGSGKTTLLNLIGGIDSPSKGRIIVNGQDIGRMSASELTNYRRNNIGFIFQFFNLIPNLTAKDFIFFSASFNSSISS